MGQPGCGFADLGRFPVELHWWNFPIISSKQDCMYDRYMFVITTIAVGMVCDSPSQGINCKRESTSIMSPSHEESQKGLEFNTFKALGKKVSLVFITCDFEDLDTPICYKLTKEIIGSWNMF